MAEKKPKRLMTAFKLPPETREQLKRLAEQYGSQANVIVALVDREDARMPSKDAGEKQEYGQEIKS